ncbi:MAG TPA: glycerophosphodiester phosphodiesterase [Clostridiales bacterium]|nr:glycerophosphodiester phosphodiesterase [Clostridiales bacterium]
MTVTAHSGAYDTEDNTLFSVKEIVRHQKNIQIIELDLTFRPDGFPVMLHAENAKITEGESFEEALLYIAENSDLSINIDLKNFNPEFLPAVNELIKKYDMLGRVFFTGVSYDKADTVKSSCPDIRFYINHLTPLFTQKAINDFIEKIIEKQALGTNIHYGIASKKLSDSLHEKGLLLSVWTVNDKKTADKLKKICVDNITSRNPDIII